MTVTKLVGRNSSIDFKTNQITFLDSRFYTTETGRFVPSVTTIGEAFPKGPEYFAWIKKVGEDADAIRDEAGRRGSKVHAASELLDAGQELTLLNESGFLDYTLLEWEMIGRYAEFMQRYSPKIISSEMIVVSDLLGYAGTLDRIVDIDGVAYLLDIKTANSIYPFYWCQLAAYRNLIAENGIHVDKVGILWLNAKTRTDKDFQGKGWQFITKQDTTDDLELFNCTHKLWLSQNKDMVPRQLIYSLKIKTNAR